MLPVIAALAATHIVAGAESSSASSLPVAASTAAPNAAYIKRVAKEVNPYANAAAPTAAEIEVIKSTVPVLAEHGVTLTTNFYQKMFGKHPELKNVFNQTHQKTGMQPKSLAAAVHAYACYIDNLGPILPAVSLMAQKHCSLSIVPSQYPIVGTNLLATLDELLTSAGFPKETIATIISAWATAYGQLANILIGEEEKLYAAAEAAPGGWRGWRQFVIARKDVEAESGVTSFYLRPVDGAALPAYTPGQFTTVNMVVPASNGEAEYTQPRQYSLSQPADGKHFRITVKREDAWEGKAPHPMPADAAASACPFLATKFPAGLVSNLLHSYPVGHVLDLAPPFGDFVLPATAAPVVLVSAGVGITPLASMAEAALTAGRQVSFVYGCKNSAAQPLRSWLQSHKANAALRTAVYYSAPLASDKQGGDYDAAGRMDLAKADEALLRLKEKDADYFVCGPAQFMDDSIAALKARGVAPERIHAEKFGSGMIPV